MIITILCKVVDNFGDIGVAYRLAKRLVKLQQETPQKESLKNSINLIVDDLEAFSRICNKVVPLKNFQNVLGINIYNWNAYDFCYNEFSKNDGEKLSVILECFQCGRPDWMEKILFEDKLERTVQVIMIDYLTAEPYAETFHCLKSLTRSAKVQKVNFMPGFTEKTGGLIIDEDWKELPERKSDGGILVFTYERAWLPLVRALKKLQTKENPQKKILLAQGRGKDSFVEAVVQAEGEKKATKTKTNVIKTENKACGEEKLALECLPYLNQDAWDKMMKTCSILFIRGEESLSRACLSGIPFVWQAYPQSEDYQLVKVKALLERMRQHFKQDDFKVVERVWLNINKPENEVTDKEMEASISAFLAESDSLCYGFRDFALSLRKNGDLAQNLMTFIYKISII